MHESAERAAHIQFSIVTAVHDVGRYLDAFIASIDAQTYPSDRFEVIAVDDGSTDDSLERLRAWEARRPELVRVVTQENAGQGAARNVGLTMARGDWVTFTDPDDILDPAYLSEIGRFLEDNPATGMVAARFLMLDDATGGLSDTHPLRRRFGAGNVVRNLVQFPTHFHGSAPAAFFRTDRVRESGLEFDLRVRPNFEDGHFTARYLLDLEPPTIGFVSSANYHYRKRKDSTSTLQRSLADPSRYTNVMRYGYLDVLRRGAEQTSTGMAPEWLQNFVLYELSWYFSTQDRPAGAVTAAVGEIADEFHELMAQVLRYISPDVIAAFSTRPLKPQWREILLHAYSPEAWHSTFGHVASLDRDQGLVKVVYRYTRQPPVEELLSGGAPVPPHYAKVRDIEYHGRVLLHERILWMSALKSVRVRLDGRALDLQFAPPRPNMALSSATISRNLDPDDPGASGRAARGFRPRGLRNRLVAWLARSMPVRRRYEGAWVLMDRIHDSADSGEILFRYLRRARADINAWFVVESGTPDWQRLRREYGSRVVAHGSLTWKLLMANCRHLVSSHADVPVINPPQLSELVRPSWRFTFLQHGVIKDDISAWLNPKPIDIFVTSTPQELDSIAADNTPYVFTTKEVRLTGLPRFDRLRELALRVAPEARDLVLVAPTWRSWLVAPLERGSQRRTSDAALLESDFVRCWMEVLAAPELEEACRTRNLTLAFLPHPNLQPAVPQLALPPHVRPMTFEDNDVQEIFARSAAMLTDYSSMAFNAAYIDRPVVYFQFDRDRFLGGEHVGRGGYFDYERDGFGPVTTSAVDAVRAMVQALGHDRRPDAIYQARIDATFPMRDGRCCERVVAEIEASTRQAQDPRIASSDGSRNLASVLM